MRVKKIAKKGRVARGREENRIREKNSEANGNVCVSVFACVREDVSVCAFVIGPAYRFPGSIVYKPRRVCGVSVMRIEFEWRC